MRIKSNWKYVMMAAAVAIGTTSCKDDEVGDQGSGPEEDTAYMTLTFTQPKSYAYNPGADGNTAGMVTAEEVEVKNAYVFFLSSGTLKAVAAESAPQQDQTDDNVWTASFKATTGTQTLFVGLNLSAALKDAIEAGGVYNTNDLATLAGIYGLADNTNGFAMFSEFEQTETIVPNPSNDPAINKFQVNVTRLVAKVYVEESDDLEKANISNVTFRELRFAMGQMNSKIYALQFRNNSNFIEDPNFDATIQDFGTVGGVNVGENVHYYTDFISEFRPNGYKVDPIDHSVFRPVGKDGEITGNKNVKYVPENTSKNQHRGELTYACVRAEFIPLQFASYDKTLPNVEDRLTITDNPAPTTHTSDTYYVIRTKSGLYMYFTDEDEAADYFADNSTTCYAPEEYEDGYCYYYVLFNKKNSVSGATNNHDIIRNEFYNLKVTKISQLGYPKPDITEPEIPTGQETNITVEVTIKDWTVVAEDHNLGR
ncbi:MAG: Mfa1 family fimbria major subunit [Tannerellaceae bacterium]|nr:Mfa1 family fimbria major subunit [Tannerellaceae bacterium]